MKDTLPFGKINYVLFLAGCLLLVLGYVAAGRGPHDGFVSLTLSPLLLALAYLVVFPAAILVKRRGD